MKRSRKTKNILLLKKFERLHDQIILKNGRKKIRKEDVIEPVRFIRNLLGDKQCLPRKPRESSSCAYIEYESDSNTYFKQLLLGQYLEDMRKHFVDTIEELKSTRFLWKIYSL